jgi:hypothetical protein
MLVFAILLVLLLSQNGSVSRSWQDQSVDSWQRTRGMVSPASSRQQPTPSPDKIGGDGAPPLSRAHYRLMMLRQANADACPF